MDKILITLTAPSCAGKSYLFDYIRDQGHPCLVSTTTRPPRAGEVDGRDYYFISQEESLEYELNDDFAELMEYRGIRYGVTRPEFHTKLNETGIAFLIVEPTGIDHYVKPALDVGASHLKVWIDVPLAVRIKRFAERLGNDVYQQVERDIAAARLDSQYEADQSGTVRTMKAGLDRLYAMGSVEQEWHDMVQWDLELSGESSPQFNLKQIMKLVKKHRNG